MIFSVCVYTAHFVWRIMESSRAAYFFHESPLRDEAEGGTANDVYVSAALEYRVSRLKSVVCRCTMRTPVNFVRAQARRGYCIRMTVSACFAVWYRDLKVPPDSRTRAHTPARKSSGGQKGQQPGSVFPRLLLSCDMLLVRYDSGVGDPRDPLVLSLTMLRDSLCSCAFSPASLRSWRSPRSEKEGVSFKRARIIARTVPIPRAS